MGKRNYIKLAYRLIYSYFFADRIICTYPQIKAKDHRVNLYDYHPELSSTVSDKRYNDSRYNLGDYLGFVIVEFMLEKRGLTLDSWIPGRKHMYSVGSSLLNSYQNATVWGSGVSKGGHKGFRKYLLYHPLTKLDIRAVRGPLSREVVLRFRHKCPEVYGDPAILMPLIYEPNCTKTDEVLVIPQFVTEKRFREEPPDLKMVSMNTNDYKAVIDAIASSKKVITSSLHAVILSDAYGVPSVLFRGQGLHKRVDFKYLDYYASTGRYDIHIADTFEEACKMEPLPLPDLSSLQKGLIDTFPYDLWEY